MRHDHARRQGGDTAIEGFGRGLGGAVRDKSKTVRKWRARRSVEDLPMGPKEPRATVGARIKALQDDIKEAVHLLAALEVKSEAPLSLLSGADGAHFAKAIAARLRDKDDPHFARAYLRLFVSRIDVAKDKITITGPDDAIAASAAAFATSGAMVPSFAPEWRTRRDSNS